MRKLAALAALGATLCALATWGISSGISSSPQLTPTPSTVQSDQVNTESPWAHRVETVDEWAERACIENPGVDRGLSLDACIKAKTLRHRAYMDATR